MSHSTRTPRSGFISGALQPLLAESFKTPFLLKGLVERGTGSTHAEQIQDLPMFSRHVPEHILAADRRLLDGIGGVTVEVLNNLAFAVLVPADFLRGTFSDQRSKHESRKSGKNKSGGENASGDR
ncbi:hypothetical protein [Roseibium album]|uniref:hypothetical protein n=1 Tax=Roseibium album TaxID=311410 RepID=UPI0006D7E554|nr:hypothetical protein [Roseibium album]